MQKIGNVEQIYNLPNKWGTILLDTDKNILGGLVSYNMDTWINIHDNFNVWKLIKWGIDQQTYYLPDETGTILLDWDKNKINGIVAYNNNDITILDNGLNTS